MGDWTSTIAKNSTHKMWKMLQTLVPLVIHTWCSIVKVQCDTDSLLWSNYLQLKINFKEFQGKQVINVHKTHKRNILSSRWQQIVWKMGCIGWHPDTLKRFLVEWVLFVMPMHHTHLSRDVEAQAPLYFLC